MIWQVPDKRNSDGAIGFIRVFAFLYIRDFSFSDYFFVPAKFDSPGRKSHAPDSDMPDILHIFLTLKISAREISENHLYTYPVITMKDVFPVLSD